MKSAGIRHSATSFVARSLLAFLTLAVCACANHRPRDAGAEVGAANGGDPFEPINRVAYRFNTGLDHALVKPLADVYTADSGNRPVLRALRARIGNFFDNLRGPIDISNNLLQGKFKRGFSGIGRMIVNSTVGLGGLFDPAKRWGMPRYPEDFGQTLASWGIPAGPYLVLPLLGPSNLRDTLGLAFDWQLNPVYRYDDTSTRNGLIILREIDTRSRWPAIYESELESSPSRYRYSTTRSFYEQEREYQIFDGDPPDDWNDFDLPPESSAENSAAGNDQERR